MSQQTTAPRLMRYREAAAYIGISERSLWSMVASGEIRAVRRGRSVRIDVDDLNRWIRKMKK